MLIERAGTWVEPMDLLMPPFRPVVEDIPRGRVANAVWYRLVRAALLAVHRAGSPPDAIAGFVSRYALALARSDDGPAELGDALGRLAVVLGRPLTRHHALRRALYEATWLAEVGGFVPVVTGTFPPAPFPGLQSAATRIQPITTGRGLMDEARRMHHCVATLAPSIRRGRSVIYRADVHGERLTLHLVRVPSDAAWQLVEVSGFAGAAPSRRAYRAVLAWLVDALGG